MTDFTYLNYEPVVFGSVLPMAYVSTVQYSPIRRAYIDSLISSLIDLHSEPQVVYYIDRLKACRDREWDSEVLKLVNDAMTVYNRRYIYLNGGAGGLGEMAGKVLKRTFSKENLKKYADKATRGIRSAADPSIKKESLGKTGKLARSLSKGTLNLLGLRKKGEAATLSSIGSRAAEKAVTAVSSAAAPAAGGMYGGDDGPVGGLELEQTLSLEQARLREDMARLQRYA